MIAVTGATGQLGRLVIDALLKTVPAAQIVAAVRNTAKAQDLAALGVQVREADYTKPATLVAAFDGVNQLLLVSSSEVGQRVAQHRAVIDAAKTAGVTLIAYTSLLYADTSPLALAAEHKETEALLAASGIPAVVLRNGWYTENHTASLAPALAHGVVLGSAGQGRFSTAAREDYAQAAAVVLTTDGHAGKTYELAGDTAYTLEELAQAFATASGKAVAYQDLPEADFTAALVQVGLPQGFAAILADSDIGAAKGALFNDARQLSTLIGRPTTPLATVVVDALAA
jgi:NAD(P)H dehydrogenase (quinone)